MTNTRPPVALRTRQAQRPGRGGEVHRAPDRRLVALAAMLTDAADELDAGRWSEADAAAHVLAVAADAYALAYGYAGALAVGLASEADERGASERIAGADDAALYVARMAAFAAAAGGHTITAYAPGDEPEGGNT